MESISSVRGFNYSGSWGTSGLDLWMHHNSDLMRVEIGRGKAYFPAWNTARWWLSWEAWQRNPSAFAANFEAGLAIFAEADIKVIPVLFNRWRDPVCDFGGVGLEHIIPGFSTLTLGTFGSTDGLATSDAAVIFEKYLTAVVGSHASDSRVLAWDICNEPLMAAYLEDEASPVRSAELAWLKWTADTVRAQGPLQPLTIGNFPSLDAVRVTEPLCDFLSFHPYFTFTPAQDSGGLDLEANKFLHGPATFGDFLDAALAIASSAGKELLASETVWGSMDDGIHVEIMKYTLTELSRRNIGFTVHALHHSLVADLHDEAFGPVGIPGRLEFINADGSLRSGHEAINPFLDGSWKQSA